MSLSINVKNSLLLISEKVIVLGMAFLTSVLLARVAGPEIFGQFSYITSFVALFMPLCVMGLNNIATKYFVKYPKHSHHYFLTALTIRAFGALGCIVIGTFSAYIIGVSQEQLLYISILLFLQSFTLFYLVEFYFLAQKQVVYTLTIRLFVIVLMNSLKIVVILNGANLLNLIIIHGLETTIIGLSYLVIYYKKKTTNPPQKSINKNSLLGFFGKGKWLLLSGISAAIYLKIDQVMIANIVGSEEVAYYAAAAKLSEFWYVFPVLIANVFHTKLVSLKKQDKEYYQNFTLKLLSFMVFAALSVSVIMFVIASPLITFIYGESYQSSASILSIHIFASIFIFQRAIFSKWLIIEGNYKFSLISHSAGAISNITLNLLLIPNYGGIGAAWATLISYIVASFLSLLVSQQTRGFMMLMIIAMLKWPKYLFPINKSYKN